MSIDKEKIKTIAIIKGSSIGDSILSIPLLRNVRKNFPTTKIYLIIGESTSGIEILNTCPYIDKIIQIKRDKLLYKLASIPKLLKLKAERISLLILGNPVTEPTKKFAVYINPQKILENKEFSIDKPIIEMDLQILKNEGLKTDDGYLELFYKIKPKKRNRELIDIYLGRDADEHRVWPIKNWSNFIKKVIDKYQFDINIIGAIDNIKNSNLLINSLRKKYSKKIRNLVGKLPLKESAIHLSKCRFFITTNGGPMHLANALKTPLIALHGPSPDMWLPKGKLVINIKANKSGQVKGKDPNILYKDKPTLMEKISVNEVLKSVDRLVKLTS